MIVIHPLLMDAEPSCCLHGDGCTDPMFCVMIEAFMQPVED